MKEGTDRVQWFVAMTSRYGEAFRISDYLERVGAKSLEISALGHRGFVISEISQELPLDWVQKFETSSGFKIENYQIIKALSDEVIKAYLSLENAKVEKFLLFLEFSFAGEALSVANQAVDLGFKIVDLRFIRTSSPVTHLILTGNDLSEAEKFVDFHKKFKSNIIPDPGVEIKKFFEIYP